MVATTLHTAALAGLEHLVNRALRYDPASRQRLAALQGRVYQFHCLAPPLDCFVLPDADGVRLYGHYGDTADIILSGRAEDFLGLLQAEDGASFLINSGLSLQGDSRELLALQTILQDLDIDWEAALASRFGDVAAHQLGQGLRRAHQAISGVLASGQRQLAEYLRYESPWLPAQSQVDDFCQRVDRLGLAADRLAARLQQYRRSHPS